MTLPDTPFVCVNIDVEAGTRHWVEDIEGDDWEDMPPARRIGLMQVAVAVIAAALGKVIPAEVETISDCQGCIDGEDRHKWQPINYEERYVTEWQPVVSTNQSHSKSGLVVEPVVSDKEQP
jgi:hypothetical protein